MKKCLFVSLCLLSCALSYGQSRGGSFSITPRIGASISNLTNEVLYASTGVDNGNDYELKSKYKAGLTFGAEVEYQATPVIGLSLGALYSMQGFRYPEYAAKDEKTNAYYAFDNNSRTNLQYINIPLLVNVYLYKGLALKAGVQMGLLVDAESKYDDRTMTRTKNADGTYSYTYGDSKSTTTDMKDAFNKVDFDIPVGLSYEYMNFVLDARYNIGLSNVYKKDYVDYNSKNSFFTVTFGYKFTLQ